MCAALPKCCAHFSFGIAQMDEQGFLKVARLSVNFDPTPMSGGETPGPSPYWGGEKEAKNGVRLVLRSTAHHFSHYHPILDRRKAEIRLKILTLRKPWMDEEPARRIFKNCAIIDGVSPAAPKGTDA
jgi:hypothetical protein